MNGEKRVTGLTVLLSECKGMVLRTAYAEGRV